VKNVSWNDAQAYVKKLSAQTGNIYRLPSEAEWEYACRAGGRHRYCGREGGSVDRVVWGVDSETLSVAAKQANAFGLYNMSGNVWEWVQDCWHDTYQGASSDGSAWESGKCNNRTLRGGSWYTKPQNARSASRYFGEPTYRGDGGFRVARTLP
jgi:formylglycine-generating enzyme required for sulfatase activity